MQKQYSFTVKEPKELMEFFDKYKKLEPSLLLILTHDSLELRGFSSTKDLVKVASMEYSKVFDKSVISIDDNIYIGLVDKTKRIVDCIRNFEGEFDLEFSIKQLTDKSLVNLMNSKGYIENDVLYTADNIKFSTAGLDLNIKTTLKMVQVNININEEYLEQFDFSRSTNDLLGSFQITADQITNIKKLSEMDSDQYLTLTTIKNKLNIKSMEFFNMSFDMVEFNNPVEMVFDKKVFSYIDPEDSDVNIIKTEYAGNVLSFHSLETDTDSFCSEHAKGGSE